jgi:hypothetical protein
LAAVWPLILDKIGQKAAEKILYEKYAFSFDLLAFVSNSHLNFYCDNISRQDIFILILSFIAVKTYFLKMQNFFSFGRVFFQNFQTTRVGTWQQLKLPRNCPFNIINKESH